MNMSRSLIRLNSRLGLKVLREITQFYLESGDYNGIPVMTCAERFGVSLARLCTVLRRLVKRGSVTVVFGDRHPNPHIRAFPDEGSADVLKKLSDEIGPHACVYPTREHLERVVETRSLAGGPYELELALGAGQLEYRAFDLTILEHYRNDPRYAYSNNDISGWIGTHDEYDASEAMHKRDKLILQTFGFCYDENMNRAVAVFLRYLADLTPEHQQIWNARQLGGNYKLHPDYYRSCILGEWGTKVSIFHAFCEELALISEMSKLMGRPELFRKTYQDERPREFGFLVRPTKSELDRFISLLDKMMSQNINKRFFLDDIPDTIEEVQNDEKVRVQQRGTIAMLEDWLSKMFMPEDPEPLRTAIEAFRDVRKRRQRPAHEVDTDRFDPAYFREQRELIIQSYDAIRTLRLVLANHPAVRGAGLEINEFLLKGEIWTY